jgi:hypothetical protein
LQYEFRDLANDSADVRLEKAQDREVLQGGLMNGMLSVADCEISATQSPKSVFTNFILDAHR